MSTFVPAVSSARMRVYVDGQIEDEAPALFGTTFSVGGGSLAATRSSTTYNELAFYGVALTSAQIADHYRAAVGE
ncbi:MAG: hypothetical protein IT285_09540 [Bdellovibrionales bacterium]|nr:hypothetical protein [Bdellovibrionales bacterium]